MIGGGRAFPMTVDGGDCGIGRIDPSVLIICFWTPPATGALYRTEDYARRRYRAPVVSGRRTAAALLYSFALVRLAPRRGFSDIQGQYSA